MQALDVPRAPALCESQRLRLSPFESSYFFSRETVVPAPGTGTGRGMAPGRKRLFAAMNRNAGSVAACFRVPDNAVVDLGTRIQI